MQRSILQFSVVLALVLASRLVAVPPAERLEYVLLANGQTLHAVCQQEGDQHVLKLSSGVLMRIPSTMIAYRGETLDQLYFYRQAGVEPGNISSTLKLVDWCIRSGLLERAQQQLDQAIKLSPSDRRISNLQRRLATRSTANSTAHVAVAAAPPVAVVTSQQVSQRLATVPAETIQQFSSTIQPILLNRCGSNGCHGPAANSAFTLIRTSSRRPIPQRLTQRNLFNVLEQLNSKDVNASHLLTAPDSPHGPVAAGVLVSRDNRQLQQLRAWCERAIQLPGQPQSPDDVKAPALLAQPTPQPFPHVAIEAGAAAPFAPHLPAARRPLISADPFDPSPFNSRFHGTSPTPPARR